MFTVLTWMLQSLTIVRLRDTAGREECIAGELLVLSNICNGFNIMFSRELLSKSLQNERQNYFYCIL